MGFKLVCYQHSPKYLFCVLHIRINMNLSTFWWGVNYPFKAHHMYKYDVVISPCCTTHIFWFVTHRLADQ